ncbi:MAG: hypothetical protein K9M17_07825 [Mariprofundaceae bacterium]|nr:hypothetical protein [Mariprofundaceae bacterium]
MWAIFLEVGLLLLILGWIAWAAWGPTPKEFLKPPEKDEDKDSNNE